MSRLNRLTKRRCLRAVQAALVMSALAVATPAAAQAVVAERPPVAAPAPVDVAALDAYIAKARADWDVPGLAVAIVKDGKIVLEKGYGVRERGRPEPVDARTLFAIASNTKAFTAAALAALVDQKRVSWDDPVRKYLPRLELRDPVASADLRVSDLLSHRAGLGTFSGDLLWYGTSFSREEVLRRVRFLQARYPFRYQYGYSNVMFVAAGEVVAAVTGGTWDAFVKEQFFSPLGMSDTITSIRQLPGRSNLATPHGPVGTGTRAYPWYDWDGAAAAAGVISSAHDMSRWMLLQLGRGTLDGRTYFTEVVVHATLRVPAGTDQDRATKLLEKSEHVCLVSNSLVAQRRLEPTVIAG